MKNNEFLIFFQKLTDTLIEHTKAKSQETFEFKLEKQMEFFPFNPPGTFWRKKMAVSSNSFWGNHSRF